MVAGRMLARARPRDGHAVFVLALLAYVLFSLLDWITTAVSLADGGREGNPIAAWLYAQHGAVGLLVFKAVVVAIIVAVLLLIPRRIMSERVALWVATAFAVVMAFIVIGNLHAFESLQHGGHYGNTPFPEARLL